jgi:hypothetical protein
VKKKTGQGNSLLKVILWPFKSYSRILLVVIIIGFYQYQSIQIDILAREVRNLELKRNQLINERSLLQINIDQLTHINRIENLARQKFNLITSGNEIEQLVIKQYQPLNRTEQRENSKKVKLAGVH